MTREAVREILFSLTSLPHTADPYIRHLSRIVKPIEGKQCLYEMRDEKTDLCLIGEIEKAIDFLFFVPINTEVIV